MNPDDSMSNAAKETIDQTNSIEKQMAAEAAAEAQVDAGPAPDNSIMVDADPNYKPLSEIAASKPDEPKVDPTVLVDTGTAATDKPKKIKNKRAPIIAGIIVGAVLLLGLGIWGIVSLVSHDSGGAVAEEGKVAFFIENNNGDGTYAAFDGEGKQITEFSYGSTSTFRNGYAMVQDKTKTKYAIMANTGKLAVPFEKYDSIAQVGAYFLVAKGEDKKLISGKDEEIMLLDDASEAFGMTIAEDGNSTTIFDSNGEKIGELASGFKLAKKTDKAYVVVRTSDRVYVVSASTGLVKNSFESKAEYDVYETSEDNDIVALRSETDYKILWGDKVYTWKRERSSYVSISSYGDTNVYMTVGDNRYYMASDGKIIEGPSDSAQFAIIDSEHYAYRKYSDSFVTIIAGDEKIVLSDVSSLSKTGDGYSINFSGGKSANIYDKNGKPLFTESDFGGKKIYSILGKDKNGNYIVNSGTLYDKNQKELGYVSATLKNLDDGNYLIDGYKATGIMSAEGKVLIEERSCSEIEVSGDFYICQVNAKKYSLYSNKGKRIVQEYNSVRVVDNHIEADNGENIEYYTLDGEKFYES